MQQKPNRNCPICKKEMIAISTSGCCMDCYSKMNIKTRIWSTGFEISTVASGLAQEQKEEV